MDEVFGEINFISQISIQKTVGQARNLRSGTFSLIMCLWHAKTLRRFLPKYRPVNLLKPEDHRGRILTTGSRFNKLRLQLGDD